MKKLFYLLLGLIAVSCGKNGTVESSVPAIPVDSDIESRVEVFVGQDDKWRLEEGEFE